MKTYVGELKKSARRLNKDELLEYECLKQNDLFTTIKRNTISHNVTGKLDPTKLPPSNVSPWVRVRGLFRVRARGNLPGEGNLPGGNFPSTVHVHNVRSL